jgi:hypothetical protein
MEKDVARDPEAIMRRIKYSQNPLLCFIRSISSCCFCCSTDKSAPFLEMELFNSEIGAAMAGQRIGQLHRSEAGIRV